MGAGGFACQGQAGKPVLKAASVLSRLPLANARGWEALILSRDHRERLSILSRDTTLAGGQASYLEDPGDPTAGCGRSQHVHALR